MRVAPQPSIPFFLAAALSLAGCPRGDDAGDPGADEPEAPRVELETYLECLSEQTCEEHRADCLSRVEAECSECYSSVIDLGFVPDCSRICSSSRCTDSGCEGTRCGAWGQRAVPAVRDDAVFASCVQAQQHLAQCQGMTFDAVAPCEVFARREGPWAAAVYDCVAATPCDADTAPCLATLQREDLARHVGRSVYRACGIYPEDMQAFYAENDGWLKPAYRDALEGCLGNAYCQDITACLDAIEAACQPS